MLTAFLFQARCGRCADIDHRTAGIRCGGWGDSPVAIDWEAPESVRDFGREPFQDFVCNCSAGRWDARRAPECSRPERWTLRRTFTANLLWNSQGSG